MKTFLGLIAALLLSGCVHELPRWGACHHNEIDGLVGLTYDNAMHGRLRNRSHASKMRIVRPGEAVTMDYRRDRLTVTLDQREIITGVRCG